MLDRMVGSRGWYRFWLDKLGVSNLGSTDYIYRSRQDGSPNGRHTRSRIPTPRPHTRNRISTAC